MVSAWLNEFLIAQSLPDAFRRTFETVCQPLAELARQARQSMDRPVLIGLSGAQGSGKSTIAAATVRLLSDLGLSAVVLALDDLYLPIEARKALARDVHPLMITRGPPGTHEVTLGLELIQRLGRPGVLALPRFDKALDTRRPEREWPRVQAPVDVVLFEGWCVGARPQEAADLIQPVNSLEREEDPDGRWRGFVNLALAGSYQELFGKLDRFVLLRPPDFDVVADWRAEQEAKLRAHSGKGMRAEEIARFVAHYERLTRWMLAEAPARANWVVPLAADRTPLTPSLPEWMRCGA